MPRRSAPPGGCSCRAWARRRELGLVDVVRALTQPVLGVCLGMQLLCAHSEEGDVDCLGVIPAPVRRFADGKDLRVPQMGWNRLRRGIGEDDWAYFVHAYAVPVGPWTLATADYGGDYSAVIARGNFFGMQFHPERSAETGARLLRNFLSS